jgi:hypothetical protein
MAREKVGEYETTDYHYFDPFTGKHLVVWRRGMDETVGNIIVSAGSASFRNVRWRWRKSLVCDPRTHAPLLFVTGSLMYWNRSLGKKSLALRQTGSFEDPGI